MPLYVLYQVCLCLDNHVGTKLQLSIHSFRTIHFRDCKHFMCFCQFFKLENEICCWNPTQSHVFPQCFLVLLTNIWSFFVCNLMVMKRKDRDVCFINLRQFSGSIKLQCIALCHRFSPSSKCLFFCLDIPMAVNLQYLAPTVLQLMSCFK